MVHIIKQGGPPAIAWDGGHELLIDTHDHMCLPIISRATAAGRDSATRVLLLSYGINFGTWFYSSLGFRALTGVYQYTYKKNNTGEYVTQTIPYQQLALPTDGLFADVAGYLGAISATQAAAIYPGSGLTNITDIYTKPARGNINYFDVDTGLQTYAFS